MMHSREKLTKQIFFIVGFILISTLLSAQNTDRIQKKLDKIYQDDNINKLEKKAKKYKKKYPQLDIPYYYLSIVEITRFNDIKDIPNRKQWNHLQKASNYSRKLDSNYQFWKDSVKNYYILYINSWEDSTYRSAHIKKVVKTYSVHTKDTLSVYYKYYNKTNTPPKLTETNNIPVTDSIQTALIKYASKLVGIPYKYAGETPKQGFDCSGFVMYVYKSIGVQLPHSAQMQSQLKGKTVKLKDAKPGDLIFFGSSFGKKWQTQHVGIIYEYKKDEPKVIHCVSRGVTIDGNNSSWDYYWKERILFVKRLPQLELQQTKK